ncbi:transmission-blocking target antigen s230, putative [Plasmodium gallinaceum]|uniref:Transmission-blocking target antigen s230, putative n=1 Tax=Plasmodium gallinaceum TaxID=5849 RepID=A0A1J1GSF0_PLAGA|nr:transmission-blocking target antigen s230, putative [Plasmodium gallinaceum]CRG95391.1 transmission-blocking target antigen s230, putative [Plasmodium gallinaceum]
MIKHFFLTFLVYTIVKKHNIGTNESLKKNDSTFRLLHDERHLKHLNKVNITKKGKNKNEIILSLRKPKGLLEKKGITENKTHKIIPNENCLQNKLFSQKLSEKFHYEEIKTNVTKKNSEYTKRVSTDYKDNDSIIKNGEFRKTTIKEKFYIFLSKTIKKKAFLLIKEKIYYFREMYSRYTNYSESKMMREKENEKWENSLKSFLIKYMIKFLHIHNQSFEKTTNKYNFLVSHFTTFNDLNISINNNSMLKKRILNESGPPKKYLSKNDRREKEREDEYEKDDEEGDEDNEEYENNDEEYKDNEKDENNDEEYEDNEEYENDDEEYKDNEKYESNKEEYQDNEIYDDNEEEYEDNENNEIEYDDDEIYEYVKGEYEDNEKHKQYFTKKENAIKGMEDEFEDYEDIEEEDIVTTLEDEPHEIDDTIDGGYETTEDGDLSIIESSFDKYSSDNTNKEYVCDFTEKLKPTEAASKVKKCKFQIEEPMVKVKIICPLKASVEKKFDNIDYFPKKAPYVVLVEETKKLKEKKISELIYGVIVPPKNKEKKNNFDQGVIEFILPPLVQKKTVFYFICDNSKTVEDSNKGNRGVAEITIEPYGKLIKGCNYSEANKNFFTNNLDVKKPGPPCYFQLNSNEIGGIIFPTDTKSTTCFEEMIPYTNAAKWNKEKKSITDLINNSVIYNKEMNEKYFNVKYVSIPASFKDNLNLFCSFTLNDDKVHLVYVSINQEINFSLFEIFESFVKINKTIQIATKTDGKNEYTCDFTDKLDKVLEHEKKLLICRKSLKEFDKVTMKCNKNVVKYKNMEVMPESLKAGNEVIQFNLNAQYYLLKKYMNFTLRNNKFLNDYPSYFIFPFYKVAKDEFKNNPFLKTYKDTGLFEGTTSADGLVKLFSFLDTQEKVAINEKIRYLNIKVNDSDENILDVTFQVPPYIDSNEPFYFMMGCNNNKDGGNTGIVELLISKNEDLIKGCNFHDVKIDYFTKNIASSTHECTIDAYIDDIIGFNCLKTTYDDDVDPTEINLDPPECFKKVYKTGAKKDIVEILKDAQVYNINDKKTPIFLKIPPHSLSVDTEISCKCTLKSQEKVMKINVKSAKTAKDKEEIKKKAINQDNIYICEHRDFIEPKEMKKANQNIEHTCEIEVKDFLNYVEVFCPSNDYAIYNNINITYNTKKPQNVPAYKPFSEKELDTLVPHAELLRKTEELILIYNKEKVDLPHLYLFFPFYIKDDVEFNIACDNSATQYNDKKGDKLIYQITIPKRDKKVKGCSFKSKKSDIFENEVDGNNCVIDASPKDIIGFVCPSGTIKLTSCFRDAVVDNSFVNLAQMLYLEDNLANYTFGHKFSYIEVPSLIEKDISFKCLCIDLKKDYKVNFVLSARVVDKIFDKLKITYGDYSESLSKGTIVTNYKSVYLSEKPSRIVRLFNSVEKKIVADAGDPESILETLDTLEDTDPDLFKYDPMDSLHLEDEDGHDVLESIYNEKVEEEILADLTSLEITPSETYTLQVNIKAPKIIAPKEVNDQSFVCDFSKKSLIIPDPTQTKELKEIHCYSLLKPLDTLYVKCPTEKTKYATAKTKTSEADDEDEKYVISLINGEEADVPEEGALDDTTFGNMFDKMKLKPDTFFEKVMNESDDAVKDITEVLPGSIYTTMKVIKKSNPFDSYAAIVIPPVVLKETYLKVECNNNEYKVTENVAGFKGIIHLDIAKNEKKIKGCDFSTTSSKILTTGMAIVDSQEKECPIEIDKDEAFGIICDNNTTLDPEGCFQEVYDKSAKKKKFKELIPNIGIYTLHNSKKKIAYAKAPLDYLNKLTFSCACKKNITTKGTMKVTLNKDEIELEDMKSVNAVKHNDVNLCNFYDNPDLSFESNPTKVVLCKIEPEMFSEVVIQLPILGVENTDNDALKKFSLKPEFVKGEDFKIISDSQKEVYISEALKGVFGNRHFNFEKSKKKGHGFSFFVPPVINNVHLKLIINEKPDSSALKQRGLIYIFLKKSIDEDSLMVCDFTTGTTSLTDSLPPSKEKECNVRIKKGDIFGIICPKGFSLIPQGCFSSVILEYYKNSPDDNEEIDYISNLKYSLKPKEALEILGEDHRELEDIQNLDSYSNITEILNFHNYNIGNLPLDYKKYYTASYSKVPETFNSIISFSCNCYNPENSAFGIMTVQTENTNFEILQSNDIKKEIILPYRDENVINEGDKDNILKNSTNHRCDFTNESFFNLIEGKIQKNICTIDAKALDVITVKCPHTKGFVAKEELPVIGSEDKKLNITFDEKEFVTYIEETNNTFSLKDIYVRNFYGISIDELKNLGKLKADWDDNHIFYPPKVLEDVIVDNKVINLRKKLPGVLFLKVKIGEEDKTRHLPTDGVSRFLIPPYINEDFSFQIFCGKSTAKKPKKDNTSLGIIQVNISANKNLIDGCDFVNPEKSPNSIFIHNKNLENPLICDISLIPNRTVGINCPNKQLKPENCFEETYYVNEEGLGATADAFNDSPKEKIINIIKNATAISNTEYKENTYSYLMLPKSFEEGIDLKKVFVCTCDNNIIKMKIEEKSMTIDKDEKIGKELCTYDHIKKISTCDIMEGMDASTVKENTVVEYTANLSRWDKLIIKYPTTEKANYEKIFVNPLNLKTKVLFKNEPINIDNILPGSIILDKYDSRTKISEYTLRIPPFVPKSVDFTLEFNNSLTSTIQSSNKIFGTIARIHVNVNEGHREVKGCDFTGKYQDLFSHSYKPKPSESKECTITIGNNDFSGFACLSHFKIKPDNCFSSIYDNNASKRVKKLTDISTNAEHDFIKQNNLGHSLSYITFNNETKKLHFSCKCDSSYSSYTINIVFEPDQEPSLHQPRAIIKYVDLKENSFSKHLRHK